MTGTAPATPTVPLFTPDRPFPVANGTPVTWTVEAGGTGPLEYEFWVYRPVTAWVVGQAYSPNPTWVWTPTANDLYHFSVRVRTAGTTTYGNNNQSSKSVVTSGVSGVGVSASQPLPVAAGTPITWTGTATGGTGPLRYQFWLYDGQTQTWSVVQDWSLARTWTWTPPPAAFGLYAMQVWVKATNSGAPQYDGYAASGFFTVMP